LSINYDRRAPEELLVALAPKGFAHSLVLYGRSGMWGLDLQLRSLSPKPGRWATLYVGTTKAIDLHVDPTGRFKVSSALSYRKAHSWNDSWSKWQDAESLAASWTEIAQYIDQVINTVILQGKHLKEGVVQSAVSRRGGKFTMLDREGVLGFANQAEKDRTLRRICEPWLKAAERRDPPNWWNGSKPSKQSTECDIVALTHTGQLVTIEVKPASAPASSIAWSPVQARQYADQFQAWINQDPKEAVSILADRLEQQRRIGMRSERSVPILDPSRPVKPIVAVDRRWSIVARKRMRVVVDHYEGVGKPLEVEVLEIDLIGRLTEVHW